MRRQRINKAILTGVVMLGFTVVAFGRLQNDQIPNSYRPPSGFGKTSVEYNLPSVDLSWVGAGQLTVYTTTNTGQHGLYGPPPGWQYYDGMYPSGHSWFRGYTGEFPRGTKQYYCWAAGIWIGGMADEFKKDPGMIDLNSIGHTWMVGDGHRQFSDGLISGVRVATTGYYSEMSTISELWQSNQRINGEDDGWTPQDKGNFRFGQKAKDIEDYQEPWAFFEWTGQEYWSHPVYEGFEYADTVYRLEHEPINAKRRVVWEDGGKALDSTLIFLDPFRKDNNGNVVGDIVSDEDTYTVYGDYIPEKFMRSSSSWAREGYDVAPLGVQVIQRTYSWTIDDYVYMNFKIRNMNDFDLTKMYVGYFMDNDVGWADDDQIGFDDTRNLGYTYDSDFAEPGWPTSAGYLGCVYVETPRAGYEDALTGEWIGDGIDNDNDGVIDEGADGLDNDYDTEIDEFDEREQIGLSSFQTWVRSDLGVTEPFQGDVDDDGMDFAKYFEMAVFASSGQDSFEVFEEPIDVRQLASSGPVLSLPAGKEMSVTIAFVAGSSLSDLKANADDAIQKYYTGFIGPEAPPAPGLVARPGHKKIYLAWDDSPESAIDPFSGDKDFEGYRIYRSATGLEDEWDLLSEFDVDTSQSEAAARTIQFIGSSNATMNFVGIMSDDELADALDTDVSRLSDDAINGYIKNTQYLVEVRKIDRVANQNHADGFGNPFYTHKIDIVNLSTNQHLPFGYTSNPNNVGFEICWRYDPNGNVNGSGTGYRANAILEQFYAPGGYFRENNVLTIDDFENISGGDFSTTVDLDINFDIHGVDEFTNFRMDIIVSEEDDFVFDPKDYPYELKESNKFYNSVYQYWVAHPTIKDLALAWSRKTWDVYGNEVQDKAYYLERMNAFLEENPVPDSEKTFELADVSFDAGTIDSISLAYDFVDVKAKKGSHQGSDTTFVLPVWAGRYRIYGHGNIDASHQGEMLELDFDKINDPSNNIITLQPDSILLANEESVTFLSADAKSRAFWADDDIYGWPGLVSFNDGDLYGHNIIPEKADRIGDPAYIYFDGIYLQLNNGLWDPLGPENQSVAAADGDVWLVNSFQVEDVGEQAGLKYVYVDSTGLMDGVKYYYSVTSYDKGNPLKDVPPLESSKFQNITTAIPQHLPLEYFGAPELEVAEHTSGESTGLIGNVITSFDDLQGHDYEIRFYKNDPTNTVDNYADYARLIDLNAQTYTVESEVVELTATSDSSAVGVIADIQVAWGKIKDNSTIVRPFRDSLEVYMPLWNHDGNPITPKVKDSTDYYFNLDMDKRVEVSESVYDKLVEGEVVLLVSSDVEDVFLSTIADKKRHQWYVDSDGSEEEWSTRPYYIVFDAVIPENLEGLNVTIERNFASIVEGSVSIYDESGNLIANDNEFGLLEDAGVFTGTIDYTTGSFTLSFDQGAEIPSSVKVSLEYTKFFTQNYSNENASNKISFSNFNLEEAYDIALGNRDVFYGYDQVYSAMEVVEDSVLQKHGFDIVVRDPGISVSSIEWGENSNAGKLMKAGFSLGTAANPHDYKVVFTDYDPENPSNTSPNALEETDSSYAGQFLPLKVINLTTGLTHKLYNKGRMGNNNLGVPGLLDWDQTFQSTLNMIQIVADGISGDDLMNPSAGFDVATLNFTIIDTIEFLGTKDTLDLPTELDTLHIVSTRPFSTDDLYSFSTSSATDEVEIDMTKIRVVPNPYYIRARWDMDRYNRAVHFTHLPERCTVRIFTSAGSLVKILEKNDVLEDGETLDEYGTLAWNFQNENQRTVASGLYIFQVIRKDENGDPVEEFIGKFAIVLGP